MDENTKWIKIELPSEEYEDLVFEARQQGWRFKGGRIEASWVDGIENWRTDERFWPYDREERKASIAVIAGLYCAMLGALAIIWVLGALNG